MSKEEKLTYFMDNISEIFSNKQNDMVKFVSEVKNDKKLRQSFKAWPDDIKLLIVDRHINIDLNKLDQKI